jgi:hypothetical protein
MSLLPGNRLALRPLGRPRVAPSNLERRQAQGDLEQSRKVGAHDIVSPDGRWLAFTGDTTGSQEVYVQRVEGEAVVGGPMRMSESGGQWPLWRRDGGELFLTNNVAILAVEFHGQQDRPAGTPRTLFRIAGLGGGSFRNGRSFALTPDGQGVVAIVSAADPAPHPATIILNWHHSVGLK